jgi:hypothetical protein
MCFFTHRVGLSWICSSAIEPEDSGVAGAGDVH